MNNNDLKFDSTLYVVPEKVQCGSGGILLEWHIAEGTGDMIELVQPGCFDKDTEVLTSEGWKKWPDVTGDELFLSADPKTKESSWVKALELVAYRYKGNMELFTGKAFNLMTTPDHKHFVQSNYSDKTVGRLTTSDKLKKTTAFINAATGGWIGKSPIGKQIGPYTVPFSDYCELLGWYLSEGCCFDKKERPNLSVISISQEKELHKGEVTAVLEKVFKKKSHGTGGAEMYIPTEAGKFFREFGHSNVKYIPEDIKNASKDDIMLFLNAYLKGDGHTRSRSVYGFKSTERTFFTASRKMADDLMELIIKAGDRPSLSVRSPKTQTHKNGTYTQNGDQYSVSWLTGKTTIFGKCSKELVPYDDMVYDVTLEHNNTLFVRRGGKVTISGNCGCTAEVQILPDRVRAVYNDNTKETEVRQMPGHVKTISKNLRVFLKDGQPLKVRNERGVEAFNAQKASTTLFFHVNVFV